MKVETSKVQDILLLAALLHLNKVAARAAEREDDWPVSYKLPCRSERAQTHHFGCQESGQQTITCLEAFAQLCRSLHSSLVSGLGFVASIVVGQCEMVA